MGGSTHGLLQVVAAVRQLNALCSADMHAHAFATDQCHVTVAARYIEAAAVAV